MDLVVCPGCDLESSRQSRDLAERYGYLYFAAGFHPENLEGTGLSDLEQVRALCAHPKCVAVGEVGLDYYWVKTPEARAGSRDFFDAQLSWRRSWTCPSSSTTGTPTRTAWTSSKPIPKSVGCSTAAPWLWRM